MEEAIAASGRPVTTQPDDEISPPEDMQESEQFGEGMIDQILNGFGEFYIDPNGPKKSKRTESSSKAIAGSAGEQLNASSFLRSHSTIGYDHIPPDLRVCYDSISAEGLVSRSLTPDAMKLLYEEGNPWADLDLDGIPPVDVSWVDGFLGTFGEWPLGPVQEDQQDVSSLLSLLSREVFRLPDSVKLPEAVRTTISFPLFPLRDQEIQKEFSEGSSHVRTSEDPSTSCSTSFGISELGSLDLHETSKRFGTAIQKTKATLFKKLSAELVIVKKNKYGKRREILNRKGLVLHKKNGRFQVTDAAIGLMRGRNS